MRHRERRDRLDQRAGARDDQQQTENEEQMIHSQHDVLDPEPEIGGDSPPGSGGPADLHHRVHRLGQVSLGLPAGVEDPDHDVGQGGLQSRDANGFPSEPILADEDPSREQCATGQLGLGPLQLATFGEDRLDREPARPANGLLPDHAVRAVLPLAQLEIPGPHLVGSRARREEHRRQQHEREDPPHPGPPRPTHHGLESVQYEYPRDVTMPRSLLSSPVPGDWLSKFV